MRGIEPAREADLPASSAAGPLLLAAAVVGATVTALVALPSVVPVGVRNASVHLVLNTVDACIGSLVAYLLYGRFTRSRRLQDALLGNGLLLLVLAGLGPAWVARQMGSEHDGAAAVAVWWPFTIRLVGALFVMGAALTADRSVARTASPWRWPLVVLAVVLLPLGLLVQLRDRLPEALDLADAHLDPAVPLLTGHPLLLGGQAVAAICFFVAAIVLAAQASASGDVLLRWAAPACALSGFARVNYMLFPSLYTDWLYTGDLLRTGCYLLFLLGAGREIQEYWRDRSRHAVLEDRQRLARELHDGVVQELSWIRAQTHVALEESPVRNGILGACDRALDEARSAVHALGSDADEPLQETLLRAVRQLTDRYDIALQCELGVDDVRVGAEQRHALVRIAREAVHNAVRHGRARTLTLGLRTAGVERVLEIRDDGTGFEPTLETAARSTGYGLRSMRDRVRALPGTFEVHSAPGEGSVVRVRW